MTHPEASVVSAIDDLIDESLSLPYSQRYTLDSVLILLPGWWWAV